MEKHIILTSKEIEQKTKRIAYQIYESTLKEKEIVIAGINGNGFIFAKNLKKIIKKISNIEVILCEVYIDKKHVRKEVTTSIQKEKYSNKSIILVDDVLNSGSTLIYGVKHFLDVPLKRFKTAVLVNRNHKKYPVKADFKGISLSTSLKEHVEVSYERGKTEAYLI